MRKHNKYIKTRLTKLKYFVLDSVAMAVYTAS